MSSTSDAGAAAPNGIAVVSSTYERRRQLARSFAAQYCGRYGMGMRELIALLVAEWDDGYEEGRKRGIEAGREIEREIRDRASMSADPGAIDLEPIAAKRKPIAEHHGDLTSADVDDLIAAIEALRERVMELEAQIEQASDKAFAKKFDEWEAEPPPTN